MFVCARCGLVVDRGKSEYECDNNCYKKYERDLLLDKRYEPCWKCESTDVETTMRGGLQPRPKYITSCKKCGQSGKGKSSLFKSIWWWNQSSKQIRTKKENNMHNGRPRAERTLV